MGQQQLLLIILGLIVVGIAITVGISIFRAQAIDQKRNLVINECTNLASLAQQYYLKPDTYGGGNNTFDNFVIPDELVTTAAGSYRITSQASQEIVILGTANEVATAGDSVQVQITIPAPPRDYQVLPIN